MKKVCIFIEHKNGMPTLNSQKIMFMAQTLKNQYGYIVIAIILDQNAEKFLTYLEATKADAIYYVSLQEENQFLFRKEEIYNLAHFLKKLNPDIVWATNSSNYKMLFPKIAYVLGTGLCAACSDFKYDELSGRVHMIRMISFNTVYAQIDVHRSRPLMATILDGEETYSLEGNLDYPEIHNITAQVILSGNSDSKVEMRKKSETISLNNSRIIIGLGNGIRNKSDLTLFKKLAELLGGAAIGGSRELVNRQIIPQNAQIGSTGKQIYADTYIAFGISGSPQHIQGIEHVRQVIAVNHDPYAAVFQYSDYGIIGDLYEVANYMINYLGGKVPDVR